MSRVLYHKEERIVRLTLNRPECMNAIDHALPEELSRAIDRANSDPEVHVIVLEGAGGVFCAGYDLKFYAEQQGEHTLTQEMPWDPIQDYRQMERNTWHFMSIWRSQLPVVCKIRRYALAGGSDIALCCDLVLMEEEAEIGYMPARVWGCPTTAMWVYRVGLEQARRLLFTGDRITGREAERIGLVLKAVPPDRLDAEVDALVQRMATVPVNQLAIQKMVINQAYEAMGLHQTQRLATLMDGITRHSPEGLEFRARAREHGWKQAVRERDQGTWDWTRQRPINPRG